MAQAQHAQDGGESDEDCEVYFLKPVNEYNIVDKIKEANKELFAFDTKIIDADSDVANRKVTFALNLEDYAPSTVNLTTTTTTSEEITEIGNEEITAKNAANCELSVIEEEESVQEQASTHIKEAERITNAITATTTTSENDAELEEICEEINVMDMQEKRSSDHLIRRIHAQNTFDCADEDQLHVLKTTEEGDSKSMTNLLTSDYEDDSEDQHAVRSDTDSEFNDNTSKNQSNDDNSNNGDDNNNGDNDDDDDDQLSIIVASYLPNVYEPNYSTSSLSDANDSNQHNRSSNGNKSPGKVTKARRFFPALGGRFSLRRRHTSNNNAVSNYSGHCTRSKPSSAAATLPELTDLKLNYKICCEYRHATQVKLPKYTGYLSEYGLSQEQLTQREQQIKRKQHSLLDQALKVNEQDMRKMHNNERAFTTWLRNKMRFPINKTRNMYDAQPTNKNNNNNNKNKNTNSRNSNAILGNKNLN